MLPSKEIIITFKTKIKTFFREGAWKEVLIFLLFLLLSSCFWIIQSLQQTSDLTVDIPVAYTNLPNNIALNNTPPAAITINLQDKGNALLKYIVSSSSRAAVTIDLQKLNPQKRIHAVSAEYIESECRKRLPASAQILSIAPAGITIRYAPLEKKQVAVHLNGEVTPTSGFMLTRNIAFNPPKITVYGSKEALDTITEVFTERKDWLNLNHSIRTTLKLQPAPGVRFDPNHVEVQIFVEEYTEKVIEIPITGKNFPAGFRLRTFPATVQISCILPLSKYATVVPNDFEAAIFYDAELINRSSTLPVVITRKPGFLDNSRYTPTQVEYLIEQIK
jgi:hypothetical protein